MWLWGRIWCYVYFTFFHHMWKWMLRRVTGKCELLRITYQKTEGSNRTFSIESSLRHSKVQALKRLLTEDNINVDEAVEIIMRIKSVSSDVHPKFGPTLRVCLSQICGSRQLIAEVESVRKIPFSSENPEHEAMLLQLWCTLKPDTKLISRISKQWTEIGFQGDDPMTDFRGMGILGLHNLLYFVSQYPETARQLLSHSQHPKYGYSFAIVGINITSLAYQLLCAGHLKTHFYNVVHCRPRLDHFHHVYCYLLYEFDKFWFEEKPRDIMEFNRVKNKFHKKTVNLLRDRRTILYGGFVNENSNRMVTVPSMPI